MFCYRRPKWDELFKAIAERTPTNGKVGVFFCGPKGMSKAVQETMSKVQVLSRLRGLYLGARPDWAIGKHYGNKTNSKEMEQLRSRGSNVRFVFREENFG